MWDSPKKINEGGPFVFLHDILLVDELAVSGARHLLVTYTPKVRHKGFVSRTVFALSFSEKLFVV